MPGTPGDIQCTHALFELDLEAFAPIMDRYREGRRINGVIRSAQCSSKQTTPGTSCLGDGSRNQKHVRFVSTAPESTSLATDLQTAHWIGGFHEPDGTPFLGHGRRE